MKTRHFLALCFTLFFSTFITDAQQLNKEQLIQIHQEQFGKHRCATEAPSYEELEKVLSEFNTPRKNSGFTQLPIRVHIVRETDGSGGLSLQDLNIEISNLNYALHPVSIEYFIADVNYIDDSNFYT